MLQTLELSWNRLGKVGGKAVSEAQSVNTVLESLLMDVEEKEGLFYIRDIRKLQGRRRTRGRTRISSSRRRRRRRRRRRGVAGGASRWDHGPSIETEHQFPTVRLALSHTGTRRGALRRRRRRSSSSSREEGIH